jgi:4-hydroxy-4-methyl-2-oxoglutarate aldolase
MNKQPVSTELLDKLGPYSAATIHEALGREGALPAGIKPIHPAMKVCGPVFTIRSMPGDNLLLHRAVAAAAAGDVLVAEMSGFHEAGYWGEILTVAAQVRGIAGLVIDGCIRDASEIEALAFPAFCRGLSIVGTTKYGAGTLGEAVSIGDVRIEPGDVIVGDRDGLVAVPAGRLEETIARCEARVRKEQSTMQSLREGKTTLEIYGWE